MEESHESTAAEEKPHGDSQGESIRKPVQVKEDLEKSRAARQLTVDMELAANVDYNESTPMFQRVKTQWSKFT